MKKQRLGLADLLSALRGEIDLARQRLSESGAAPMLRLKEAEVEVQFGVETVGKGGADFDVYFFAVQLGGEYKSQNLHKLKVTLSPVGGVDVAGSGSGE